MGFEAYKGLWVSDAAASGEAGVAMEANWRILADWYHALGSADAVTLTGGTIAGLKSSAVSSPAAYVTFMFDDAYESALTIAKPVFDTKGVVACVSVPTSIIGTAGRLSSANLVSMEGDGWEILSHAVGDGYLTEMSEADARTALSTSKTTLEALGLTINNFVYPSHVSNANIRRITAEYYRSARGGAQRQNPPVLDHMYLNSVLADDPAGLATYQGYIDTAVAGKLWIIFYMHDIVAADATVLGTLIDYAVAAGATIATANDVLDELENTVDSSDGFGVSSRGFRGIATGLACQPDGSGVLASFETAAGTAVATVADTGEVAVRSNTVGIKLDASGTTTIVGDTSTITANKAIKSTAGFQSSDGTAGVAKTIEFVDASDNAYVLVSKSGLVTNLYTAGANLYTNGTFEDVTGTPDDGNEDTFTGWTNNASGGGLIEATATAHAGSAALKITRGTDNNTRIYRFQAVTASTPYQLSMWTRGDGTVGGRYMVYDVTKGSVIALPSTGVTGTSYSRVAYSFTTPAGCVSLGVYLYCSTAAGVVYFDDIELKKLTAA